MGGHILLYSHAGNRKCKYALPWWCSRVLSVRGGLQNLLYSHARNRNCKHALPSWCRRGNSVGVIGDKVYFILLQETECVNMHFPPDVAECIQWEGRGTQSLYSHAGNRNCKHALHSCCSRVPSVWVKGDRDSFTLMQKTETVNMRLHRDVVECILWEWRGTLMQETETVKLCFLPDLADFLQCEGKGTRSLSSHAGTRNCKHALP
jgi:hypothetical protein